MRKYIFEIILIIMFLQLFSIISFADSKPTIYIKDVTKYQDQDEVTVEVYMENVDSKIVTLGLDLFYDSSKLEYQDSKAGKDLSATIKLAENVPEESRVAIGVVSLSGLKKDGLYYSIDFKIKDTSENISLKLNCREATDSNGNDIDIVSKDGVIKISKDEAKQEEKKTNTNQQINSFEKTELEELENIENIITENGNVEISSEDNLVYETENSSIVEVLDDGTIIPNQDGKTNVRVKLNDQIIGNVEVEVKDGKIIKISGNEEKLNFKAESSTQENSETLTNELENNEVEKTFEEINTKDKENSKQYLSHNKEKSEKQVSENNVFTYVAILIVVITILFIIFYLIKKKKGGNK